MLIHRCLFALQEKLTALEELIAHTDLDKCYIPEVGDLCAAHIVSTTADSDNPWYRVQVQSIKEGLVGGTNLYSGYEVF